MSQAHVVPHQPLPVPRTGDEKAMLTAFLDRYRETIIWKLRGLSKEEASRQLVPSATTLLGVVKHLAFVERGWFQADVAGEVIEQTENDFVIEPSDSIDSILQLYLDETAKSRAIVARTSLNDLLLAPGPPRMFW